MKNLILAVSAFVFVGCSSAPGTQTAEKDVEKMPSTQASEPGPDETKSSPSEVLTKNKKCPKKSKMVNGKCMLQVETTE